MNYGTSVSQHILLCALAACVFFAACTNGNRYSLQTKAALERLDTELTHKARYQQWRQAQNDSLRREVMRAKTPHDKARQLFALSQNYVTYQLDSAAYYADQLYRLASSSNSFEIQRLGALADIDVWLGRGQVGLAEDLFRKIDTVGMTSAEYGAWFARYSSIASRQAYEADDPDVRAAWQDSLRLLQRLSIPGLSNWVQVRMAAARLQEEGHSDEAIRLLQPYTAMNADYQEQALLFYNLAGLARSAGDEDLRLYYLAESSIADLRAGTRSYASLYDLALALFDRHDYDRAAAYMGSSSDDALRCRSMVRIPISSSAAVKISEAISSNVADRQSMMWVTIGLTGGFLLILIGILWFVLWQHRRLQVNHRQLISMSRQLQETNEQLQAKNDHIREINTVLVDSNRIKERYVSHYIDLSVHYIKQIDSFRREAGRVARNKGLEELLHWLSTSQIASGEYTKFYQSFDTSFLDIFPKFIEQVNALLQPQSHFAPRADGSLTTELRILAAIRLGITDSGHIASLLNCASATVYTYRTKLRNAALDRDSFERQIARIGL